MLFPQLYLIYISETYYSSRADFFLDERSNIPMFRNTFLETAGLLFKKSLTYKTRVYFLLVIFMKNFQGRSKIMFCYLPLRKSLRWLEARTQLYKLLLLHLAYLILVSLYLVNVVFNLQSSRA